MLKLATPVLQRPAAQDLELAAGETVRVSVYPDLDAQLHYSRSRLVLTTQRVCWSAAGAQHSTRLTPELKLERKERAGLVQLRLFGAQGTLAQFYCSQAVLPQVLQFEQALTAHFVAHNSTDPVAEWVSPSSENEELGAEGTSEVPKALGAPLLRLFRFARPHAKLVSIGCALTFATTLVGLIPPYLTMPLVDEVLIPGFVSGPERAAAAYGEVALYLVLLGGSAFLTWLLAWAQGAVLALVGERVSADLRNRAFAHLLSLGLTYFGGKRTGDLVTRVSSDTDRICRFLADSLTDFVTDVLMIIGTCVVLFVLDPVLAAAALVSFPPIAWIIVRLRNRLTHGFLRGGRVWSIMTSILADAIPGIRVVKAFSQEQREIARFAEANQRIVQVNNRVNSLWTFFWPLIGFLNQVGLLVVWAVGAWLVLNQHVTVGVLTAFIAYIGRFYARVESMSRMLAATQRAAAAAQRLFEILDRVPAEQDLATPVPLHSVRGELRFDNVTFRYGDRVVLEDVSFAVQPGTMLGIVGHTGSGKSTIANLICRFYDAVAGEVKLDGVDVRRFALHDYRSHIGIVLQDPFLFFGTIADNVAYGKGQAQPAEIVAAARAAMAHEFILRLPEGYDTMVGERGQSLSGGERQRVAIARAILVDPKILILDEATSAVDPQTEREIQHALDNLVTGRTTVAIAHRLSTLRRASQLVVLKAGKVVEVGTHTDLLLRNGEYARLHRAQARGNDPTLPTAESQTDAETETAAHDALAPSSTSGLPDAAALPGTGPASSPVSAKTGPLLAASDFEFWLDETGELWAKLNTAEKAERVLPRRCFPLTNADRFISVLDERGHELTLIEDMQILTQAARNAVLQSLQNNEFLPIITRVTGVSANTTQSEWSVITDRGPTEFVVNQEENVRSISDDRILIIDKQGVRYLIQSLAQLDRQSQRWVSRFA